MVWTAATLLHRPADAVLGAGFGGSRTESVAETGQVLSTTEATQVDLTN